MAKLIVVVGKILEINGYYKDGFFFFLNLT